MASIGLFPSLTGLPLVGNAVTGLVTDQPAFSVSYSNSSFHEGPQPDLLLSARIHGSGSGGGGSNNDGDEVAEEAVAKVMHNHDLDQKAFVEKGAEALIRALKDPSTCHWGNMDDLDVILQATIALGKIGDPRAVELLIPLLQDDSFLIQMAAAKALGKIGDPRAIPHLEKACRDQDMDVRDSAERALDRIRRKTK